MNKEFNKVNVTGKEWTAYHGGLIARFASADIARYVWEIITQSESDVEQIAELYEERVVTPDSGKTSKTLGKQ